MIGRIAILAVLFAPAAQAADIPVTVCAKMPLPGPEHILNPHDPPAKQVRETATVCEEIKVPGRILTPTKPLTYQPRNPRSFA